MNVLELKSVPCDFSHINLRKEGNEEKGLELANDLKLVFETDGALAFEALVPGCKDLIKVLYPNGRLLPAIKLVEFDSEFDRHDIKLKCGSAEVTLRNSKLKGFQLKFLDGNKVGVTFMAQVKPSLKQQATLADFLKESAVILTVLPPATLPGVVDKGRIEGKPTGKQKGAKPICPDCTKPIEKESDGVQASAMDKNSPRIHKACFRKRANKKTAKKKATKKKK